MQSVPGWKAVAIKRRAGLRNRRVLDEGSLAHEAALQAAVEITPSSPLMAMTIAGFTAAAP